VSVTTPEPSDTAAIRAFVATVKADVRATVEHHAPCVPECPVCYPKGERE
jgi:hypothetical protein